VPDWAIVLVAAFGGGLAGAVLQPVTAHVLETIRRDEETRNRRERHLRRMLLSQMAWGIKLGAAVGTIRHFEKQGHHVPAELRKEAATPDPPSAVWQPERIQDSALREAADRLQTVLAELLHLTFSSPIDDDQSARLAAEFNALRSTITLRMDELNYPEVDG
jgi:glucose-6-phosphate-specific signal transduction histidine kinase